jgi:outer membrane protein W
MTTLRLTTIVLLAAATASAQPAPAAPPAVSATAQAEPTPGWAIGVAPRFGLVAPTSKLGLMVIGGLQIDYVTPALDHRLLIGVDVSVTRPSHDGSVMDTRLPGPATYTVHEAEMVIALLASYRFAAADKSLVPWIGAGPMVHLLSTTESTSIAPGDNSEVSTEFGVELGGGADFRAGPGYFGGDLRVAYSKLDHQLTGSTNAGKVAVSACYRFVF